jgi:hypothetical protein
MRRVSKSFRASISNGLVLGRGERERKKTYLDQVRLLNILEERVNKEKNSRVRERGLI